MKIVKFTPKALAQIKRYFRDDSKLIGVRLNFEWMSFSLELIDRIDPYDSILQQDGVFIYLSTTANLAIDKLVIDYEYLEEDPFTFRTLKDDEIAW